MQFPIFIYQFDNFRSVKREHPQFYYVQGFGECQMFSGRTARGNKHVGLLAPVETMDFKFATLPIEGHETECCCRPVDECYEYPENMIEDVSKPPRGIFAIHPKYDDDGEFCGWDYSVGEEHCGWYKTELAAKQAGLELRWL